VLPAASWRGHIGSKERLTKRVLDRHDSGFAVELAEIAGSLTAAPRRRRPEEVGEGPAKVPCRGRYRSRTSLSACADASTWLRSCGESVQ
jgi:hypothetical protein